MFDITRRNNNNRNVSRYNPYREMEEFERNFFSDPFGSFFNNRDLAEFKTDVIDEGDHYLLEADLPGFEKKDIKLDLDGDVLTVNAERHSKVEQKEKDKIVRVERSYGSYSRSFDMSGIDTNGIKAAYENGVLKLTLPRKKKATKANVISKSNNCNKRAEQFGSVRCFFLTERETLSFFIYRRIRPKNCALLRLACTLSPYRY